MAGNSFDCGATGGGKDGIMDGVGGSDAELAVAVEGKEKVNPRPLSDDTTCCGSGFLNEIGFKIG